MFVFILINLFVAFISSKVDDLIALRFDPDITETNVPIGELLKMAVVSENPSDTGLVLARVVYTPRDEDEPVIFEINQNRTIKFKPGLIGYAKLLPDSWPPGYSRPTPMRFELVTTLQFLGMSGVMLINSNNFIFIAANIRPNILNITTVYLLCDLFNDQQYLPVQTWTNVPFNRNYALFVDQTVVSPGQVCQLTTSSSNQFVFEALQYVEMISAIASPFGGSIDQITAIQAGVFARINYLNWPIIWYTDKDRN